MIQSSACKWCGGDKLTTVAYSAKARWIVADPKDENIGRLLNCGRCNLLYFDDHFTDDEVKRMYVGYRGAEYLSRRKKYEPWYTKRINDAIGHSTEVLATRRTHLEKLILDAVNKGQILTPHRILDVGGDEGQFMPDIPGILNRAVLEVSGVKPVVGVETLETWAEAEQFQPDLIMMCHVLEHAPDPLEMIRSAANLLTISNLLYLEIPLDRPNRIPSFFQTSFNRVTSKWIARHPRVFTLADLISLVSRRMFRRPLPGSIIKQSEHINFFDEYSLNLVLVELGFQPVVTSAYTASSGVPLLDVEALGILYQRVK